MERVKEFIHNIHAPTWLGILVAIVLILRIPSFFEPYYYGDEMIYLTLGQGIRQAIPLYSNLHDNKPPLIYLLGALAGNLFWFKVILATFNVASVILFWKLAEVLFPKKEGLHKISTTIFGVLTTLPFLEGNTINAELLMVAPTLGAFWLLFGKRNSAKNLLLAGILFSIASLFKIPAIFDFPVIIVFWFIISKFDLKKIIYLVLGFLLPLGLSFIWFYLRGAGSEYLTAAYLQNLGYVSSWRQGEFGQGNFLTNNIPLITRALAVTIGAALVFVLRKKLSKPFIFLSIWLLFSLFAVTLSERPYPHYLIQALPAVSLFFGILIADKTLEQSLSVIPLALFFFVPNFYNFWSYQTGPYYARFLNLITNKISHTEYVSGFNQKTATNYKIAEILSASTTPDEKIFVWGSDSPTVYALSRRLPPIKYVADYHVFDYSSQEAVFKELSLKKPNIIVFLPGARPYPSLRFLAQNEYLLVDNTEGAEIWVKSK